MDGNGNCASAQEKDLDTEKQNWKMENGDMFLHKAKLNCRVHWHNVLLNMRHQKSYTSVNEFTSNEDYWIYSRDDKMCQYIIFIITILFFF